MQRATGNLNRDTKLNTAGALMERGTFPELNRGTELNSDTKLNTANIMERGTVPSSLRGN